MFDAKTGHVARAAKTFARLDRVRVDDFELHNAREITSTR
ncbi:hypothetical protein HMPREF3204_00610 [Gardnerella pickettii]|nr:hypothetical protein HMPREF3204_00610 [Gardnerella pickettii]